MAELGAADIAWRIGAVLVLVLLNGFFVAAEFAIVKVRMSQIESMARAGNRRAKRTQHVVENLDAYLSASQLGITLASLGLGWVGEPAVADLLTRAIGPYIPEAALHTVAFALAFAIITFLHITLGEQAPKMLAIQKAERTAMITSLPLRIFRTTFMPAIWALNGISNMMVRALGVDPSSEARAHTEEELRLLLAESGRARAMSRRRAEILLNVMDLKERRVEDIMVPRPEVTALDATRPLDENLRIARESGFTRFPLVRNNNLDDVVGMVHLKDLLWFAQGQQPTASILALRREIPAIPASVNVEQLLDRFLRRRAHLALVVDEHGGTAGIVTLEDVLEEFVGEIQDEFDVEEAVLIRPLDTDEWMIEGAAPLHRVSEALGTDIYSEDATTFGGFIVAKLGRVPTPGTEVEFDRFTAVVRSADRKRVKTVHVKARGR